MTALDGFQVYSFFRAGSRRVNLSRSYIDSINVFPVPDGDTGTNLSVTITGALDSTVPEASASVTLGALADAALISARGNSGVIFAQFVSGLSEAVKTAEMRTQDFAAAVRFAYDRAKAAISDPRDGTMLSVIEEWAASLASRLKDTTGFADLIGATRQDLRDSLQSTTLRLAELREAGVVDAGAAGFVEFVEGGHDFLIDGKTEEFSAIDQDEHPGDTHPSAETHHETHTAPPTYRYCTEAIVSGTTLDAQAIRDTLKPDGDSLIVAVGRLHAKVHVHTNNPEAVMAKLFRFGAVSGQKVDDMRIQYSDAHDRRAATAIVTDSSCDLPAELLERHRIHVVPLLLAANGSEYLDKLTLSSASLGRLAESKTAFPHTAQPPAHFFSRLYAYLGDYYDHILAIHLSAAMSGTFDTSLREARKTDGRTTVFDSRHLSGSLALLVLRAAEAVEAGMDKDEILARLPEWSAKARILVSVTSLRYMVKGGRVSPLKGFMAKVLNLKPIISVDAAGKSTLYGKSFSERANLKTIIRMTTEIHRKAPLRWYAIGHAAAPEKAAVMAADLEKALGFAPLYVTDISAVVALNSGPGAVSVVTMSE